MSKTYRLFAYGTLIRGDVLESVIGRRLQGAPAVLSGYRRLCMKGACYPAVVPSEQDSVEGVLYRDVTEAELVLLDAFEGREYDRISALVNGVSAQMYILAPAWIHLADARPWSPDMLNPEQVASFILEHGRSRIQPEP